MTNPVATRRLGTGEFYLEYAALPGAPFELPWRAAALPRGDGARARLPSPLRPPRSQDDADDDGDDGSGDDDDDGFVVHSVPRKHFNGTLCDGVCFSFEVPSR